MYKRHIQPLPEGFLDQFEKKLGVKRDSVELDEAYKRVTLGGTSKQGNELFMGEKGIDKMIAISKQNPKTEYTVRSDKYGNFKSHWLRNGKFAKQTVANIEFDMDRNAVRGKPKGKDVKHTIFSLTYVVKESLDEVEIDEASCKKSMKEDQLDPVDKKAVKKDFDDRKDQDIDNDGDVDSSDNYLHKRRKAISKAIAKKEVEQQEESYKVPDNYAAMKLEQRKRKFEVQTSKTINDSGEYEAIDYGRKKGYKEAGVISDSPLRVMVLFNLRPEDKADLRSANVKSGEKVFRYATRQTVAGDIFPLIKVNLNKGIMYFLTQESSSGENDEIKFETRGVKLKVARMLSGVVEQFELDEATDFRKGDRVKNVKTGEKGTVLHKGNRDEVMVKFGSLNKSLPSSQLRLLDEFYDTGSAEEVHMAMRQLEFIAYACDEISDYLEMRGDMDEWFQNKLAAVHDRMMGLHAYIEGDKRMQGGYDAYGESHIPYYGEEEVELDEAIQESLKSG